MTHGILPFLFTLGRNLAIEEKLSKDRVCPRCAFAGMFRDSHFVAFLRKVMVVVRDASVLVTSAYPVANCVWLFKDKEPVLEGY